MTKEKRQKKQLAHEKRMQALNKQKDVSNSEDVQTENNVQNSIQAPEGQLISKCSFGAFRLVHVVGQFSSMDVMKKVQYFLMLHFQFLVP